MLPEARFLLDAVTAHDATYGVRGDALVGESLLVREFSLALSAFERLERARAVEVQHDVDTADGVIDECLVEDRAEDEFEVGVADVVADVVVAAGREVIEDHDLVAPCQQGVDEVGPHEASSPGDEHAHGGSLGGWSSSWTPEGGGEAGNLLLGDRPHLLSIRREPA